MFPRGARSAKLKRKPAPGGLSLARDWNFGGGRRSGDGYERRSRFRRRRRPSAAREPVRPCNQTRAERSGPAVAVPTAAQAAPDRSVEPERVAHFRPSWSARDSRRARLAHEGSAKPWAPDRGQGGHDRAGGRRRQHRRSARARGRHRQRNVVQRSHLARRQSRRPEAWRIRVQGEREHERRRE